MSDLAVDVLRRKLARLLEIYGRNHAAICLTVVRYRARGALRDVGKALVLPDDLITALASQVWGWSEGGVEEKHATELNLNLADRRLRLAIDLARQLISTPRYLSQHSGGFVLTRDRLDELVPIEPARMADLQVIEWDKDDIDALKFMKVDCLALGMLTCMKRAFDMLDEHEGSRDRRLQAGYALDDEHDRYGIFAIDEEQAVEIAFDSLKKNVDYSMFWNLNFRKLHRAPRTRGRKPGSEPKG